MRIDGVNPQHDALSEDFVPVHLAALVAGHHFAHRHWVTVEDGGEAFDYGLGGGGHRHEAGLRVSADQRLPAPLITQLFHWPGTRRSSIWEGEYDCSACSGSALGDFAAHRAGRATKTLSNGSNGTLGVAHGRDDCALLGGEMLVDFRCGGTLQQKVLHLLFENATNGIRTDKYIEKVQK